MGQINSDLRPNSKTRTMNKLVLFLLVGFALISLSAGNEEDNELVEIENTDMMELNNMETLELAEPEAMPKRRKNKKRNKKKGNKKNKRRRNKKNKKGKNKKNKKGKNKKNKKKNNKRNSKRRNKKKNSKEGRSGPRANTACATNINKYLFYLAKAVVNFEKQLKRAGVQKNLTSKKSGKKGDYATALSSARDAAGGNLSAPKCGSNSTSAGAMKFKEILGNLSACSANIQKACSTGLPAHPNDTELAACKTKVQEYWWKMGNNTAKTDLCTAFGDNDTMKKYNAVKTCITKNMTNNMTIKQWATKVATARTACLKAFQQCRVSERAVGPAIQTCSKTSKAIITSLNALQTNNASANTVKAKVKNLTSTSGRHNRAVPTTCTAVAVVVKTFTVKLGQNPEADVKSETTDISGITLAAGKCSSIATELNGYVTKLDTIITAIAAKMTILQAQLTSLTGSTASSSQIAAGSTASSTAATTASGRKRRASLLKILNKVNMH